MDGSFSVDDVQLFFSNTIVQAVVNLAIRVGLSILVLVVGMQVIKMIRKVIKKTLDKSHADKGVVQFLDSLMKAILYIILGFTIAGNFGVDAASLVAILGSAGVAVGLALQGSLSNFAGGVLILLLKPFVVGDYIIEDNKGNEGKVIEIQLFYTKLKTGDNRTVILPNGALANTSITNVSDTTTRRIDLTIGISYEANVKDAKCVIEEVLHNEQRLIKELEQNVYVEELADSCVVIGVRAFSLSEDFKYTKWDLLEQIKEALEQNDISIPYPQVEVHIMKQ